MKATILDLRRRMSEILRALDRNESITILHRGKTKGVLRPARGARDDGGAVRDHAAFGMWKDRRDVKDVAKTVRRLRKGRVDAL
ncbi:MAG: type II toxin-antitoxin system Phd/YefM family antitoxin [Planctomycetes bacterium]|nr:type II toxin-antitoxin system Phd/YefM family antitoxin [Planctomycetota bacterium]